MENDPLQYLKRFKKIKHHFVFLLFQTQFMDFFYLLLNLWTESVASRRVSLAFSKAMYSSLPLVRWAMTHALFLARMHISMSFSCFERLVSESTSSLSWFSASKDSWGIREKFCAFDQFWLCKLVKSQCTIDGSSVLPLLKLLPFPVEKLWKFPCRYQLASNGNHLHGKRFHLPIL